MARAGRGGGAAFTGCSCVRIYACATSTSDDVPRCRPAFQNAQGWPLRGYERVPKNAHPETAHARCANKNKTFRKQRRRYDNEPVDVDLELVGNSFPSRGEGGGRGRGRKIVNPSHRASTALAGTLALIFILSLFLSLRKSRPCCYRSDAVRQQFSKKREKDER